MAAGRHPGRAQASEEGVIVPAAVLMGPRLLRYNRETIDGCREQAEKAKKAVRCTIEVKSANDGR